MFLSLTFFSNGKKRSKFTRVNAYRFEYEGEKARNIYLSKENSLVYMKRIYCNLSECIEKDNVILLAKLAIRFRKAVKLAY